MNERAGTEQERTSEGERPVPDLTSPSVVRGEDQDTSGYDSSDNTGGSSNS